MNGMDAVAIPWAAALEDPERLLAGDPALVYLCRPNNPTGHLAPRAWVDGLLAAAGEDGPLVILDEAYVEFGGDSLAAVAAERPGLLVTRTLSKAFGLAGLRVGYAVGTPGTVLEVEKSRGPYKVSRPASAAAAAALRDRSGWALRTVQEAVRAREELTRELERRGLEPRRSWTNFILFRAPTGDAAADAGALRRRGVAVRPFPRVLPGGGDGLRVTVAPERARAAFLAALDDLLAEHGGPGEAPA